MARQLLLPAPLALLALFNHLHPLANLALHRPHATARLTLTLNILRNDKRLPLDAPLHLDLLDPPDSLHHTPTTAALRLVLALGMPRARAKQLRHLLHAHVGGKGGHLTLKNTRVRGRSVVLVLGQLGPHTAEDAEAGVRHVRRGRARRRRVQRREDKLGRVHLVVEVRQEG